MKLKIINKQCSIILTKIFRNFYISALENKFINTANKPNIYLRYADDRLLPTNSTDEISTIQETFQNNSVLYSTQEININNKIPFLGVLIVVNCFNENANTDIR